MARPTKKHPHKGVADREFTNVYEHLSKVDLGPFRFYFDSANNYLYLQYKAAGMTYYVSIARWHSTGAFDTLGPHTGPGGLPSPGR